MMDPDAAKAAAPTNAGPDESDPVTPSLLRLRASLKFSLWAWAAYWPGIGLVLALKGMDAISMAVCVFAVTQLGVIMAMGALRTDGRYTQGLRTFLFERPLYLVFGLFALLILGTTTSFANTLGFAIFAGIQLVGLVLVTVALSRHIKQSGLRARDTKADQLYLTAIVCGIPALAVFLDALRSDGVLGMSGEGVFLLNAMNLVFPTLLLIASRPFREPLRNIFRAPGALPARRPAIQTAKTAPTWDYRFEG